MPGTGADAGLRAAAPAAAAAVLVLALVALLPSPLTDGDSCVYAALGRQLGRGGPAAWVAPTWDVAGETACFHEHPPAGAWGTALLVALGVPWRAAPLVANAAWTLGAVLGVVALARRFVAAPQALLAGAAFLLHAQPLKYVQRAALEFPLAAYAAWTVVAALRLREHRAWTAVFAAALAGAFLTRGAVATVLLAAVAAVVAEPRLRPPPLRVAAGVALAAAALVAFDAAHAAATGHGFWGAYLARQVVPSLEEEGTRHASDAPTVLYFLGRAALYALPWALLPLGAAVLRRRARTPWPDAPAWRLAAVWIAVTIVGASVTNRPASRYLFQAWVPASLLVALALPATIPARLARLLPAAVPLLVGALAAAHAPTARRDDWTATAEALRAWRDASSPAAALPPVRGAFPPTEGRLKSLVRWHLDTEVHADAPGVAPSPGELRWTRPGEPPPPGARVLVETPLGRLAGP